VKLKDKLLKTAISLNTIAQERWNVEFGDFVDVFNMIL